MKVLAIDFGTKRVGLAVGDTQLGIALPKGVLKNDEHLIERIYEIVHSTGVGEVVVGLPLTPSGKEGQRAREVKRFVESLKEKLTDTKVVLWDERYTTLEAETRLKDLPPKKRKELLDSVSAQIILEDYLQSR